MIKLENMIKLRVTKKQMRQHHRILSIGYCKAQHLLNYENSFAYSSGIYGWCCDYYVIGHILISTGYSPLSNKNMRSDYELIRKYDDMAINKSPEERRKLLEELLNELTIEDKTI